MEIENLSTDAAAKNIQLTDLKENALSNHSSRCATPNLPSTNTKNDSSPHTNSNIKAPSLSPPLLLLNNNDRDEEPSNANSQQTLYDSTQPKILLDQSMKNKQFAMIESNDLVELNSIIDLVKSKYPHVNIHLCTNPSLNTKLISNMNKKNNNKINIQRDNNLSSVTNNYKNCLTANYLYDCHRRLSSDRTLSVERQESRDSGFWSMKSLSLSDSHYNDHALINKQQIQQTTNANAANHDRLNSNQDLNASKNVSQTNDLQSRSQQQGSINTSDVTVNTLNPSTYCWKKWKKGQVWRYNSSLSELENLSISNTLSTNKSTHENESKHSFETNDSNSYDSSQLLQTAQNQNFNSPQHPNDPKYSTTSLQAFNYSSGLNLSENEHTKLSQSRSTIHLSDYANNSSSFETATLSPLRSIAEQASKASSSIMWSSTSILDKLNTTNVNNHVVKEDKLNLKGNKRRGKLTRDITIDKDDEHSFNNGANSLKTLNNNEKSMLDFQTSLPGSNSSTTENNLIKHELRLLHSSSNKSLSLQYRSTSSHQNGRISPPEKRVSLSFEENSDKIMDSTSDEWARHDGSKQFSDFNLKNKTLDRSQMSIDEGDNHLNNSQLTNTTSSLHTPILFNNQQQQQQQSKNLNSYLTRLLTQNYFVNDDILKQYKNNMPPSLRHSYQQQQQEQINSNKMGMINGGLDSTTSPSTSPSPSSYSSLSPLSTKTSISTCNKQVNNSTSPDMMSAAFAAAAVTAAHIVNNNNISNNSITNNFNNNNKSNESINSTNNNNKSNTSPNPALNNHYEFYKDLQSKLIIRANSENEESSCRSSISVGNKNHSTSTIDKNYKSPINFSSAMTTSYNLKPSNTSNFLTSQQTKQICRSSSSPSYSSSADQQLHGELISHSPSSALSLSSNNNRTVMLNQINMNSQHTSAISNSNSQFFNQTSIFNQVNPPNNKSASNFNIYETNNSKGNSNFQKVNEPFFQKSSSLSNQSLNNEDESTCTLINGANNHEIKNLMEPLKQQIKNNLKPPEIVITESKPDTNEQQVISYQMRNVNFDFNSKRYSFINNNENFNNTENILLHLNNLTTSSEPMTMSKQLSLSNENLNSFSLLQQQEQTRMFQNWKPINLMSKENNSSHEIVCNNGINTNSNDKANNSNKNLKPHICQHCQKRFARSDMLIRHSRLHSGIRPYKCNRCGQEFSRSDHLNTHLRTHTGEKPYSCPYPKCNYAACRKDMITRHLKVHTKNRLSLSFDADNETNKNKLASFTSKSFETNNNDYPLTKN